VALRKRITGARPSIFGTEAQLSKLQGEGMARAMMAVHPTVECLHPSQDGRWGLGLRIQWLQLAPAFIPVKLRDLALLEKGRGHRLRVFQLLR